MPYLQTGIGVILQKIDTNHYVVSSSSKAIVGNWFGVTDLSPGDHVIIQRLDNSKNAHILGTIVGDQSEGMPGSQTTTTGSGGTAPIGNGGDSGNIGVPSAGSSTFAVLADNKYGYGPLIIPYASSASWMRFYGQNATTGVVSLQGAVYANTGGSLGTIAGSPGSLLGTTQIITINGSQLPNWYVGTFSPNLTLDAGQYHFVVLVGGTTFLAGFGTAATSRWGPDNDLFSDGPSNPYGVAATTPNQYAAITLNMNYVPRQGGVFELDTGSGFDLGHIQP